MGEKLSLSQGFRLTLCVFFFLVICLVALFFYIRFSSLGFSAVDKVNKKEKKIDQISLGELDQEPFKLSIPVDELLSQMRCNLIESREGVVYLKIFLPSQKDGQKLVQNEKLYLTSNERGLFFSDHLTNLFVEPISLSSNQTKLKFVLKIDELELSEERTISFSERPFETDLFFKDAKVVAPDLFLELYNDARGKKHRLIFPSGETLYLQEGDSFIFSNGKWESTNFSHEKQPLFLVKSLKNNMIELKFWNPEEENCKQIKLTESHVFAEKVGEDFIGNVFFRNNKLVSCTIDKQRFILKERDLLVKRGGRWRKETLKNELNVTEPLEFFVLDKLELVSGKGLLKGLFFNKEHSSVTKIDKVINKAHHELSNVRRRR